jgi:hypothetical protein
MSKRIRLNGGHTELTIEGVKHQADDTGAFTVPDEHASELIRVYGGALEPGIEQLEERIEGLEADLVSAKNIVNQRTADLKAAQDILEAYKKKIADIKAEDAKKAADAKAKVTPPAGQQQGQNQTSNNNRR